MDTQKQLAMLQHAEQCAQDGLDTAQRNLRAFINNNNLNKQSWPDDSRIDVIGQNGNTGEHYD